MAQQFARFPVLPVAPTILSIRLHAQPLVVATRKGAWLLCFRSDANKTRAPATLLLEYVELVSRLLPWMTANTCVHLRNRIRCWCKIEKEQYSGLCPSSNRCRARYSQISAGLAGESNRQLSPLLSLQRARKRDLRETSSWLRLIRLSRERFCENSS